MSCPGAPRRRASGSGLSRPATGSRRDHRRDRAGARREARRGDRSGRWRTRPPAPAPRRGGRSPASRGGDRGVRPQRRAALVPGAHRPDAGPALDPLDRRRDRELRLPGAPGARRARDEQFWRLRARDGRVRARRHGLDRARPAAPDRAAEAASLEPRAGFRDRALWQTGRYRRLRGDGPLPGDCLQGPRDGGMGDQAKAHRERRRAGRPATRNRRAPSAARRVRLRRSDRLAQLDDPASPGRRRVPCDEARRGTRQHRPRWSRRSGGAPRRARGGPGPRRRARRRRARATAAREPLLDTPARARHLAHLRWKPRRLGTLDGFLPAEPSALSRR